MQILVIAATEAEIQPFIAADPRVDILISGVGVPATIYHLQKRMQQIDYELIIQAGIAGSFTAAIGPGQTVLVKQDTFADLGMEEKENYTSIFDAGLADKDEFPFQNGWLLNEHQLLKTTALATVKAITVNKVSDSALQMKRVIRHFDPQVESMEGAALHFVCLQENIPFLQLRTISNQVGERDRSKWKMKEAIANLNIELAKLINQLTD